MVELPKDGAALSDIGGGVLIDPAGDLQVRHLERVCDRSDRLRTPSGFDAVKAKSRLELRRGAAFTTCWHAVADVANGVSLRAVLSVHATAEGWADGSPAFDSVAQRAVRPINTFGRRGAAALPDCDDGDSQQCRGNVPALQRLAAGRVLGGDRRLRGWGGHPGRSVAESQPGIVVHEWRDPCLRFPESSCSVASRPEVTGLNDGRSRGSSAAPTRVLPCNFASSGASALGSMPVRGQGRQVRRGKVTRC